MRTPVVVVCPNESTYRVTYAEAERLVSLGRARRESKKLIRLRRDRSANEGCLQHRQSGRYGPTVIQVGR